MAAKKAKKRAAPPAAGVTLDEVRELALALPETHERTSYGAPAFRVRDKLFARVLDDGESIVLKMDMDQREAFVLSAPHVFSVTPHYQSYPMVIVRLGTIHRALLRELLTVAWRRAAPRSLAHKS